MDEKASCQLLETASLSLVSIGLVCTFTVVSNCFIGLECTEHTSYDLIIGKKEASKKKGQQDLSIFDMLKVLRNVGVDTPIILLFESMDKSDTFSQCFEMESHFENNVSSFCCAISKPFSSVDLSSSIKLALGFPKSLENENKAIERSNTAEDGFSNGLMSSKAFSDYFCNLSMDYAESAK